MSEHDLRSAAFPKLDAAQMAAVGRCALTVLKRYRDGEKLFEAGDRDLSFDVIKAGEVEIIGESGESPRTVVALEPGDFTGDVSQLTGGPAIVSGIVRGDTEVYEVSPAALRRLLDDHPELGDVILRAFIARRHLLSESGQFVGLRVIGSGHSPATSAPARSSGSRRRSEKERWPSSSCTSSSRRSRSARRPPGPIGSRSASPRSSPSGPDPIADVSRLSCVSGNPETESLSGPNRRVSALLPSRSRGGPGPA
jgi:CRP-like cAMP-binding protein